MKINSWTLYKYQCDTMNICEQFFERIPPYSKVYICILTSDVSQPELSTTCYLAYGTLEDVENRVAIKSPVFEKPDGYYFLSFEDDLCQRGYTPYPILLPLLPKSQVYNP